MKRWIGPGIVLTVGAFLTLLVWLVADGVIIRSEFSLLVVPGALAVLTAISWVSVRQIRAWHRSQVERARHDMLLASREDHRRFLSRLDHELKNPLTALRMGAHNLNDQSPELAAQINGQVDRLQTLVTELRKISEIEAFPVANEPIFLPDTVRDVFEDCAALGGGERTLSATFPRAPRPLPPVYADRDLLHLALFNLVSNAVKYSAPGAQIEVRAYEAGDIARIEVSDTGRGIPAHEIDVVWAELSRGSEARDVSGTGLGLAMVRAIMRRMNGVCSLSSIVGQGTTVHLSLPLAVAASKPHVADVRQLREHPATSEI